ncbi:MAG: C40 family peptidase [Acidimicrobiales bacterium]
MAARLNSLDAQMAREDEALDQAKNRLAGIQTLLAAARSAVASARDSVESDRQAVQHQAILAYVNGYAPSSIEQILQSSESSEALRQSYLDSITASEQSSVDTLRGALLTLDQRQSQLQGAEAIAAADVAQVRAARDGSARAASAEQSALSQVKGRLADLVAQIDAQQQAAEQASFAGQGAGASLPPPSGAGASLAVSWAQQELGKPYVYGAAGPDSFDCSGLTMYVWGKAGVSLPHSAAAQWDDTVRVPISDLAPGDLVFYYQPVDHVGIYVGGGEMIVAPHTGTNVQYQSIFSGGLDGGGRVG